MISNQEKDVNEIRIRAKKIYQQGKNAFEQDDISKAVLLFKNVITELEKTPNDPPNVQDCRLMAKVRENLGQAYFITESYSDAIDNYFMAILALEMIYRKTIEDHEQIIALHQHLVNAHLLNNDIETATSCLKQKMLFEKEWRNLQQLTQLSS